MRSPGHYALYPTYVSFASNCASTHLTCTLSRFSETNTTSYRPTNEDCLMRIVTTPNFCKACLEGLWLSLLRRVDFIDTVTSSCTQVGVSPPRFHRVLDLDLVPLGQFRLSGEQVQKESYSIAWKKDGVALEETLD